ncbi:MAG: restriction endonuclease subunit S [Treponema sp.]|nr:restriction endonuclease subunit S [Treponema sp.]
MMKKNWEIKKQNLEGRTPSTCEAGVSPLQTTPLPQHALKAGWEIKKLSDVCDVRDGTHDSPKFYDKGYPLVTSKNLKNGKIEMTNLKYISKEDYEKINERSKVDINDILFAMIGTIGNPVLVTEEPDYAIKNMALIKDTGSIFPNYLLFYLSSNCALDKMLHDSNGTTQRFVSLGYLRNFEIPVPPLEEQKRIVKILDEKFAQLETIKTNAQTNLQNAKDLFQSQLTKAFNNTTWEKAKLEDIALDFSRGKSKHRPRNDKCLFGGNYPFIQTGDIRNADKYVTDYSETYNETGLTQSKLWPEGTLCITIAANIAETAILSFPCCFPDSVIGFIPNEKRTTVDFVYYLIQFFKSELQKLSKGAAQDNLNLAKFENMNFPLPPLSEQKRIVKELDTLSEKTKALQNIYEQMLLDCEELKQSVLAKAFEGNL